MIDLVGMNPEQKKAVETTNGPLLVLAGAGSGKTRVLTYRIAYILDSGLAGPSNILAVTFTNKAATEMKERVEHLLSENSIGSNLSLFWMGTFHSICVRILRRHGGVVGVEPTFSIYDSSDQQMAIKEAMKRQNISIKEFNPRAIAKYISSAKNELVSSIDYESFAEGYFQNVVAEVYPVYQKVLEDNNALDFDDLIFKTVNLLKKDSAIKEKLQETFKYILVDEYQDTNHAQYVLISLLAEKYRNICCVGDDDQSIYSFRGATVKNILNFEKDYPEANVVKLEQNYRSTRNILEAAYQVISINKSRKDKKLWTENTDGQTITLFQANDEKHEGNWIADKIKEFEEKGESLEDMAVLYRTNAQSRSLEESFISKNLPYRLVGGVRFYDRKEIKDVLAYLRAIYNPKDLAAIERIINVPKRGIGDKTFQELVVTADALGKSVGDLYLIEPNYKINPKLNKFLYIMFDIIQKSRELNIVDLINYILEHTGYLSMLEDGTIENESRIENLKELVSVAAKYSSLSPQDSLRTFLEEVSLLEGGPQNEDEDQPKVTLMTIHASKGLEFKYVFIAGAEENLFPHQNSISTEKELEEERRLAYVAITRAKEKLYLTHTQNRTYFGSFQSNPISRFIKDIDPSLLEVQSAEYSNNGSFESEETAEFVRNINFEPGDYVKHEYFGTGKVLMIDDEVIEVDFGAIYGVKELMLEYAKLERTR